MSNKDENLLEYWDDLHHPEPQPTSVTAPRTHPGDLVIGTSKGRILVRIHPDGTLTYGPEYTPDEAAVEFWTQMSIRRLESEERVLHLGFIEQMLLRLGNADVAHESAVLRSRRPEATEHDRFMAEISRLNLESVVHQTIEFSRGLVARPNPPPTIEELMRPRIAMAGSAYERALSSPSTSSGEEPPTYREPTHHFCTSCEASPWHHDFDSQSHCQCGAPWENGRCSFVAANS